MFSIQSLPTSGPDEIIIARNEILTEWCQNTYCQNLTAPKGNSDTHLPFIFSLPSFIEHYWQHSQAHTQSPSETLLSPLQSLMLWDKVISHSNPAITHLAYQAWQTCRNWHIDSNHLFFQRAHNTREWSKWAKAFIERAFEQQQVDIEGATLKLIQEGKFSQLSLPKKIKLFGFEQPTPLAQKLFSHLKQEGCTLEPLIPFQNIQKRQIESIAFEDAQTELNTMANWALQSLNTEPQSSIVCAIFDLKKNREDILAAFQNAFHSFSEKSSDNDCPWHMPFESKNLTSHPIVQTALDIIQTTPPFHLTLLSRLLRSPYLFKAQEERSQRTQLERALRNKGSLLISLTQLIKWSEVHSALYLARHLKTLEKALNTKNELAPSQWAEFWQAQLKIWEWPNIEQFSKEEKVYYNRFVKAMTQFADLDSLIPSMKRVDALATLNQHLNAIEVPYSINPSKSNIQLVDIEDIESVYADKSWVLGAHQADAHTVLAANPFIPYALQENILNSNAPSSKLALFAHQAQALILSHVENTLAVNSTFSIPSKAITLDELNLSDPTAIKEKTKAISYETFEDAWGPQLLANEVIQGGTDLIRKQALCPFRAFADYRLSLKHHSLALPFEHPSYREKAAFLHRILKTIWHQLKDQKTLQALSEPELEKLLFNTIEHEIHLTSKKSPHLWKPIFTQTEKNRVYHLLHKWLTFEKKRPPFEVKATEYEVNFSLGPLTLSFVIDRIDQLSDNVFLLIDYKTSLQLPSLKSWTSTRPTDPQLPLYALSLENNAQAIAWAHLSLEYGGKFLGLSAYDTEISGIRSLSKHDLSLSWPNMLKEWQTTLETLAHQFYKGYAGVDPKDGLISCRHCPYTLLCRIHHPND